MTGLEQRLLRTFRRAMPSRIQQNLSSDRKDALLRLAQFCASRPGLGQLGKCLDAQIGRLWRSPEATAKAWQAIADQWPAALPALIAVQNRHAQLAQSQDPMERAQTLRTILGSLDGPHALKCDKNLLDALAQHIQGEMPAPPSAILQKRNLQRIVLCVDRLKMHGTYTHARVVLAICRNLLLHQPDLHIHLVIAHEHLATGDPPDQIDTSAVVQAAQDSLGALFEDRFFLHQSSANGLDGLVATCQLIHALEPDVILYGGGHRGPVSNEARVIRHCLFPRFPTALFFFQADDQVDTKLDLVIARGPHRIVGTLSDRTGVCVQPYPTLGPGTGNLGLQPHLLSPSDITKPKPDASRHGMGAKKPVIVSAIAGKRMEARLDELGPRALQKFLTLLDAHPEAVWHFIGSSDPDRLIAGNRLLRKRVEQGQVIVHPVLAVEDFERIVESAALFLHLPGFVGGSGGAAIARRSHIPILTFRHSDVASRQPAEIVFDEGDIQACVDLAKDLLQNPTTASEIVTKQAAHIDWLRVHSAPGFLECLSKGMHLGQERLAQGPSSGMAAARVPD